MNHPKGDLDLSEATWTRSGDVEVAFVGELTVMRQPEDVDNENVLVFTDEEWIAFIAGAKDGEFDPPQADT